MSNGWAAGTYTTTSNGYPDSNCNTGGTSNGQSICHGNNGGTSPISWPQPIITDAAVVGLTLTQNVCIGNTTEVIPLVLSTNSICTGQHAIDILVPACSSGNINNFILPISSSDATHGTKLSAPSTAGNLKFVINPANTLGGYDNSGGCDNISDPLFFLCCNLQLTDFQTQNIFEKRLYTKGIFSCFFLEKKS